jgi:hypothetical protein
MGGHALVYKRSTYSSGPGFSLGGLSSGRSVPRDIIILLVVQFVTFSLRFFPWTEVIPDLMYLTPDVYAGQLWRLVTYQLVGVGGAGIWFLIALLMIFWFGRDVFYRLGRRRFWHLLAWAGIGGGLAAALVQWLLIQVNLVIPAPAMFIIMQGQSMLLIILVVAFSRLYADATVLFMFILPIKGRWLLWVTLLMVFLGFLGTRDFAGFVGAMTGTGITISRLTPGGPGRMLREWRRRIERFIIERRLARLRRKRTFDIVDGDGDDRRWGGDRWINREICAAAPGS